MKRTFQFLALLAVGACFAFALPKNEEPKRIVNIVIDAAHGGKDFGATHDGVTEKQITDEIASKIRELNTDKEVVLHFTREGDKFADLNERITTINAIKPDLVLSLHVNYTKQEEASGMEFFVIRDGKNGEKSSMYATRLSDKFGDKGFKVRDIKTGPFYLLTKSESPVVLVELGFLSNETDREYLTNPDRQEQIAGIIAEFLNEIN
jgi:N-acetylmuramoyl-L-alanine amidase